MNRKQFIFSIGLISASISAFPSNLVNSLSTGVGNFRYVYSNSRLRATFYKFLQNVFSIYPAEDLHNLISNVSKNKKYDEEIYKASQGKLNEITPLLSVFKYQLPALFKQKNEMAKQTMSLLGKQKEFNGYLEIGSLGRYLDYLEEKVEIKGERYYADGREPGYAITEMVDRGQICIGATYIPMANYETNYIKYIKNESLDLVTVYIGFHHCPLHLRTKFISSIRNTMRIGGKLILRDHDCDTEEQKRIVALAHDVFNMGTKESWEYNQVEIRNFYSLDFIINFVSSIGFNFEKKTVFQDGDPTKNALMMFTKI